MPVSTEPNPPNTKGKARSIACPKCGYNLAGLHDVNCPECGTLAKQLLFRAAGKQISIRQERRLILLVALSSFAVPSLIMLIYMFPKYVSAGMGWAGMGVPFWTESDTIFAACLSPYIPFGLASLWFIRGIPERRQRSYWRADQRAINLFWFFRFSLVGLWVLPIFLLVVIVVFVALGDMR